MADERLVTVKSSGGDYTSLAAAIAGEAGNLVAADEWLHIECYAMTDITEAHITGFTTSSDCRIVVDTPLSERHQGAGDVYASVANGDIYKQAGGTGDFVALSQETRDWRGMAASPNWWATFLHGIMKHQIIGG